MFKDGHHVINRKKEWSMRSDALTIRETPSLIPRIWRPDHNYIHKMTPEIPLLGYFALQKVVAEFYPTRDTLETIDNLMFAIETAHKHPKINPIERSLGDLAIMAIDIQRPYIEEALAQDDVTVIDFKPISQKIA